MTSLQFQLIQHLKMMFVLSGISTSVLPWPLQWHKNKFSRNSIQTHLSIEITGNATLIFALEAFQITEQIKKNQNAFASSTIYTYILFTYRLLRS